MAINVTVDNITYRDITTLEYGGQILKLIEYENVTPVTPPPEEEDNKDTILRDVLISNYDSAGEMFVYTYDTFDKDNDTILIDYNLNTLSPALQNVFTVLCGKNKNTISNDLTYWDQRGGIHLYAPSTTTPYKLQFEEHDMSHDWEHFRKNNDIAVPNDGHCIFAVNINGSYCNGKLVFDNTRDNSFIKRINQLTQPYYIGIGSKEGTTRSYAHYNEISVVHKLYTAEELITLTSI